MRWIVALPMLALFGTVPAVAQDRPATPFAGTSLTLIGGVEGINRFSDWNVGAVYGVQFGHDWRRNDAVLGIEGEVTGASGHQCGPRFPAGTGAVSYCTATGRDLYVGGRIGTLIGDGTLLYGKAGYTNVEQSYSGPQAATATPDGFRLGLGLEHRLTGGMSLKAEYRYSHYEGSLDRHQTVIGLGFRF